MAHADRRNGIGRLGAGARDDQAGENGDTGCTHRNSHFLTGAQGDPAGRGGAGERLLIRPLRQELTTSGALIGEADDWIQDNAERSCPCGPTPIGVSSSISRAQRLSWMQFFQMGPDDRAPDANTLWGFREALIAAGALDDLFGKLDQAITAAGYLQRGGQIIDASLVAAPRQRNTDGEKAAREGRSAAESWRRGSGFI